MDSDALRQLLEPLLDEHAVPGASVAVLNGDRVTAAATGVLNTATGVPVTPDSLFQIGSVTKVWTATVLMRLVEQDRVGLDTPAEDVLRYQAALGHETGTDGVLRPAEIWGMPRSLGPAGTINATAADVLALARLHLHGGVVRYEVTRRDGGLLLRVSENDDLSAGPKDYDVELAPLPDGRFAGRWPFQTAWTPVRFLRLAAGDVLHVSGRATPRLPAG